jgi:HK97 family phage prohead protease
MFYTDTLAAPMQIKSFCPEDGGKISGYASVFSITDSQGDVIEKGAFKESLKTFITQDHLPKMLWQHQAETPIGKWTCIREDDYGLYVEGQLLLSLPKGREAYDMIKNKMVDGLSIGCRVVESIKGEKAGERLIKRVELVEISLVTFAANQCAKILSVKSLRTYQQELLAAMRRAKMILASPPVPA